MSAETSAVVLETVRFMALLLSRDRKLEKLYNPYFLDSLPSTHAEKMDDWINACATLAIRFLEGRLGPFDILDEETYSLFSDLWWRRVKQVKAYQIWKDGSAGNHEQDFDKASSELRALFFSKNGSSRDFSRLQGYLQRHYFDEQGKLAEYKFSTQELIRRKALRIWQTTGEPNSDRNWHRAKLYCSMYYENIIGAVTKRNRRNTAQILKAFEFSKSPDARYLVTNAFEVMIASEFLDKDVVASILDEPDAFDFSMVPVENWPSAMMPPAGCNGHFHYDPENEQIIYEGEMTDEVRLALRDGLSAEHKDAVDHLCEQSRLKPFREMIL